MIKQQKYIEFINDCGCIVDNDELRKAILWYQQRPTAKKKHIYLHGCYPAVSILKEKLHIHRLLMLYWNGEPIPSKVQIHHINGNKKDARRENLILIDAGKHQSLHNKGKTISENTRKAIIEFNKSRKGCRMRRKRNDVMPEMVFKLHQNGMTFNQISKRYNLSWECVKQRYNDATHDNLELLEGGE